MWLVHVGPQLHHGVWRDGPLVESRRSRVRPQQNKTRTRARGARTVHAYGARTTYSYAVLGRPCTVQLDESTERNGTRYGINVERFELARTHASLQLSAYRTVSASAVGCVTLTVPTDGPSLDSEGSCYTYVESAAHTRTTRARPSTRVHSMPRTTTRQTRRRFRHCVERVSSPRTSHQLAAEC